MNTVKTFFYKYWPYIGAAFVVVCFILLALFHVEHSKKQDTVQQETPTYTYENHTFFPLNQTAEKKAENMTRNDVKDISHRIEYVERQEKPTTVFYADSQQEADKKAEMIKKQDNPKAVIVKQEEAPKETEKAKIYTNNYYAIDMNRKHDIKVGAAYVDDTTYISATYRNRDVSYTGFYSPEKHKGGAGVSVTVAKW